MKLKGFKNSNIYVSGKGIVHTSLKVSHKKIEAIAEEVKEEGFLELEDKYIVIPGFIDKHIHGANGSDFMNPTPQDIEKILTAIAKEGTTSCLATTMTQSIPNLSKALENIASYMRTNPLGVEVIGIHLEGPFISPVYAGAQPAEYILSCDYQTFNKLNQHADHQIKQITIAYEENGRGLTKALVDQGIVVSLGHTNCNYELGLEAVSLGASSTTHTFNAMRGLHHRDIGVLGLGLLNPKLSCELICDLIHVSKPAVQLLYQNKGKDKICLITDSMEAKWMPDGQYQLGGQSVIVQNHEARLTDGTLAGSTLKMNEAVYNFMKATGATLTEAIDCATINPAKCLQIDDRKGSIEIGKDADFIVIDQELNVYMTVCRGEIVYSKL